MAEILFARLDELSSAVSTEVNLQISNITSGLRLAYSTTTSDADPGNGTFRFNNATIASATAIYIDNLDAFGNTISAYLDTWDDSTNTVKGTLYVQNKSNAAVFAQFKITGSVVDGTGYRKVTLSSGVSAGVFTAGTQFIFTFVPAGDKGIDGTVTGPGVSVDGEIVLFNGTSGGVLKRATTTGILKATSGVLSAAVSGTDYAPATSGTSILKGNGSGGFSSAVSSTDYAPATSGTSILKGNGSGGFGNAVSNTDYQAPIGTITGVAKGNGANALTSATAGTDFVKPDTATAFTKHQYFTLATLADAANISWNVSTGQKAKVTLGGNRTMNAVSNAIEGASYFLWVIQDATGSRTITWTTSGAGSFDFGTPGAPTLTTTASRADLLTFEAISIAGTLKLRYTGIVRGFA